MGLPSGVMWSPVNIDIEQPGGFAKSPFQYDCSFFSWGNVDGHNPTGPASFSPWSWGGINEQDPWYDGQVYGDTPGNTLNGNIPVGVEYDAARANLGAPWRIPTSDDFVELLENCVYIDANGTEIETSSVDKRITMNGIVGLRLRSKINGNVIFIPATGNGGGTAWNVRGAVGNYWSSSWNSDRGARGFSFGSDGVSPSAGFNRFLGFAVRPVVAL